MAGKIQKKVGPRSEKIRAKIQPAEERSGGGDAHFFRGNAFREVEGLGNA